MPLLCSIQDETKFTSLKVSVPQNNHEESPKRDPTSVLTNFIVPLGFFSGSSYPVAFISGINLDPPLVPSTPEGAGRISN